MKVNNTSYRSIWFDHKNSEVKIIDQRWLPHEFRVVSLKTIDEFAVAISDMWVRGAPLIGATAAYAVATEMGMDASDAALEKASKYLNNTRPTAVNLKWSLNRCTSFLRSIPVSKRHEAALNLAHEIADEDVETNRRIGLHGLKIIKEIASKKASGEPVRLLTHCNAGWLATVDWGTATSPMYQAHNLGIPIHVWVDETRPRNQGALTSWELGSHGIAHSYIVDNAGGHLMQHGMVDMVIVGTDRTTATGDVCNKIGTYLKALAAKDNDIPFYVALPSPTIDWTMKDGISCIPIEERNGIEVSHILGKLEDGSIGNAQVSPDQTNVGNPAFDVTPNKLISGLITERGVSEASYRGLKEMFPDFSEE